MPGPQLADRLSTWQRRRRRADADAAARRTFDRLAADPGSYRAAPSRTPALVVSVLVLVVVAAVPIAALALALLTDVWCRWPIAIVVVACYVALGPRPARLPREAMVLPAADHPGVHALVGAAADRIGVRPPRTIAVGLEFNARVQTLGWSRRPALVIGLPLWCSLPEPARLGLLGHELGHLRHDDLLTDGVVTAGRQVVRRVIYLLRPTPVSGMPYNVGHARGRVATRAANLVLGVLSVPWLLLDLALARLAASANQHAEYLADRRAAELAGSLAVQQALATDTAPTWTRVAAASRRGIDPWEAFAATPAADADRVERHRAGSAARTTRRNSSHPPDHLRIALLGRLPRQPGVPFDPALMADADRELAAVREQLRRKMADRLLTTYYS